MTRPSVRSFCASPPAKTRIRVMIDSGAFSAYNLGKSIDLDAYCTWLHENMGWIDSYINLDKLDPHNLEDGARQGWENYRHMRRRGLRPIPVLHAGENVDWLHRYLDDGADYVALAAVAFIPKKHTDAWYAAVWDHLVTADGSPAVKVHALGEGRVESMIAFPWKSVDTASWFFASMVSGTFKTDQGQTLNMRADGQNTDSSTHVKSLDPESRALFETAMAAAGIKKAVFDSWTPRAAYVIRSYLMALYFKKLEGRVNLKQVRKHIPHGLFQPAPRGFSVDPHPFCLHLVLGTNPSALLELGAARVTSTLMSYYYITNPIYANIERWTVDPMGWCQDSPHVRLYYDTLMENVHEIR